MVRSQSSARKSPPRLASLVSVSGFVLLASPQGSQGKSRPSSQASPAPRFALRPLREKPAFGGLFLNMGSLSMSSMSSCSSSPSPCIAFLYLPKGGFAPYWHLPPKCRQKKPPLFFAPIVLRASPRRGTKDHPSFVPPAPRNPPPFAVSGERAGGGEVRGVCQIPAPAR